MQRWLTTMLLAGAIAVAGCSGSKAPPTTPDLQHYGSEIRTGVGEGHDHAARDCLWQAVEDGKPAAFLVTIYTDEGDPITYGLKTDAAESSGPRFVVIQDTTQDRFGQQGIFAYECAAIEQVPYADLRVEAPGYTFRLSECTGPDTSALIP